MMKKMTLPERIEEFSDAKREGFMEVRAMKEEGKLIAGVFCAYTPTEVLDAAGIVSVGLCGTSQETIPDAEKVLPRNLCPLIKSSFGFAITDKCPYFYYADVIIGETTCDGKKKMYELLSDRGMNTYVMHLPQGGQNDYEIDFWKDEIHRLIDYLEEKFDLDITEEKLRQAVKNANEQRKLRSAMFELQQMVPPPMWGTDMIIASEGDGFKLNKDDRYDSMESLIEYVKEEYEAGSRPVSKDAKRIMITGCPLGGAVEKIGRTIENNGGVIVCYDTCGGTRSSGLLVDEDADDIVHAMADRYLKVGCSVLTPNTTRLESLKTLLEDYKIDGVVEVILQSCHTYNVEAVRIKDRVQKEDVPYILIETDYSESDMGQLTTRIQAFVEML